ELTLSVRCSPFMSSRADMYRQRAADAKARGASKGPISKESIRKKWREAGACLRSKWSGLTGKGLPSATKKVIAHHANGSAPTAGKGTDGRDLPQRKAERVMTN